MSMVKVIVIIVLVLAAVLAGAVLLILGFIFFSGIAIEFAAPKRQSLLDTTFQSATIKFEKLEKQDIGFTRSQYVLWLNGRSVWSSGDALEKNIRVTPHRVVPVHPEDLEKVISIHRFPPLPESTMQPKDMNDMMEMVKLLVVGSGNVLWLSPKEVSENEFKLLTDFIALQQQATANSPNSSVRQLDFPLFVNALVYADDMQFAPRIYQRKHKHLEETITVELDGTIHFRRVDKNDFPFGQSFGHLSEDTKTMLVNLNPSDAVRPLSLTVAEIESFVNAQNEPLRQRYAVQLVQENSAF